MIELTKDFKSKQDDRPNRSQFSTFLKSKLNVSTEIIKSIDLEREEFIEQRTTKYGDYKPRLLLAPKANFDLDPQFWFHREEKARAMVKKADPNLSRTQAELVNFLAATEADLPGRMGYIALTSILSSDADTTDLIAARVYTRLEAELWSLYHDFFWILGFIRTLQFIPGVGVGSAMTAKANVNKINTAIASLEGIPIDPNLLEMYFNTSHPSARAVVSNSSLRNSALIRIPMCIFGVGRRVTLGINRVGFTTDSDYPSADIANMAKDLDFYPSHLTSVDSHDYGWLNSGMMMWKNKAAAIIDSNGNYSAEYATCASDVTRLFHSLTIHLQWLVNRIHAIWGISDYSGYGQAANTWIGNTNYNRDNSEYLFDFLTDKTNGLFTDAFSSKSFSDRVFENLTNPRDDVEYVKEHMTMHGSLKPVRKQAEETKDDTTTSYHTRWMRAKDTIWGEEFKLARHLRVSARFQNLPARIMNFYKSLAFEVGDSSSMIDPVTGTYSPLAWPRKMVRDPNNIIFRPDITMTAAEIGTTVATDGDDNLEIIAYQMKIANSDINNVGLSWIERLTGQMYPALLLDGTTYPRGYDIVKAWNSPDDLSCKTEAADYNSKIVPLKDALGTFFMGNDDFPTTIAQIKTKSLPWGEPAICSGLHEAQHIMMSMDDATFYLPKEECLEDYSLNINKTFVDPVTAMATFPTEIYAAFDVAVTSFFADGLAMSDANVGDRLKPWTLRSLFNDGDVLTDPLYCIDYEIVSSVPSGTHIVDLRKQQSAYNNKGTIPFFLLRPTSVDNVLCDILNMSFTIGAFVTGGRVKDNVNVMATHAGAMKCYENGILPMQAMNFYNNIDTLDRKLTNPFAFSDTWLRGLADEESIFEQGATGHEFDALVAIRPYVRNASMNPTGGYNAITLLEDIAQVFDIDIIQERKLLTLFLMVSNQFYGPCKPANGLTTGFRKVKAFNGATSISSQLIDILETNSSKLVELPAVTTDSNNVVGYFARIFNYRMSNSKRSNDDVKPSGKVITLSSGNNKKSKRNKGYNKGGSMNPREPIGNPMLSKERNDAILGKTPIKEKPGKIIKDAGGKKSVEKANKTEDNDGGSI